MREVADPALPEDERARLSKELGAARSAVGRALKAGDKAAEKSARARVHGPEGRTFHGEAELFDEGGILVARFRSVFRVARGQGFVDP